MKLFRKNFLSKLFVTLFALAWSSSLIASEASLSGRIGNMTSYQLHEEEIRHSRFEFHLLQNSRINPQLNTVVEGRFRFDATLLAKDFASQSSRTKSVRDDEMVEAEARQVYVDYLNEILGLKIGLQQIDWAESLSPRSSDILTPVDLRHGGNGNAKDIIEPVFAASVNHSVGVGSFEWLLIPLAKPHRLPKGPNGYGYYEYLQREFGDHITQTDIPKKEAEFGLRWLHQIDSWDLSVFGFRGHQRSPALRVTTEADGTELVEQTHPAVNTFSINGTYGGESTVVRLMSYFEPRREPALFRNNLLIQPVGASDTPPVLLTSRRYSERRATFALGFDYVHSADFKAYTEHYYTHTERIDEGEAYEQRVYDDKVIQSGQSTIKVTNESFDDLILSIQGTLMGPEIGYSLSPEIAYTKYSYRFAIGAYVIESRSAKSTFDAFKDSDQVYARVERYFDLAE